MNPTISVPIFVESRYKVDRKKIKKRVEDVLVKNGIVGPVEVSIAIIGDRKMKRLNSHYRGLDKTTNVLSFSQTEGEPTIMPTDILILGDVAISYPMAIKEATDEEELVDDRICFLVEHGLLHLLGQHHE
jgi:probable rRNA maturation factor